MAIDLPVKRGRLRLRLGRAYYTCRRHLYLATGGFHFARQRSEREAPTPYLCCEHSTPLLRRLRDVDMQLQYNKVRNLRIAAPRIDGAGLMPGETLSYWRMIGKPTYRKGYCDGMVLFCGAYRAGVGGGLCQLSNLIYWLTLHTPLTVVERYRHSYDVFPDANRTQPFGSGATCVYNYRDLMIRNDTPHAYRIRLWLDDERLHGCWMSSARPALRYEVYERNHRYIQEAPGIYSRNNEIWRRISDADGALISDALVCENHALMMYAPLIEAGGKP